MRVFSKNDRTRIIEVIHRHDAYIFSTRNDTNATQGFYGETLLPSYDFSLFYLLLLFLGSDLVVDVSFDVIGV